MADDNKKTCAYKIKIWIFEFYKTPCFWLKLLLSLVIFILASIGIYSIATSAFYHFDEPLSSFDPERLGQLGDFLGGTLNPIFGFLTVCLLLWSIFIQRKELSLTRDELKKSAEALTKQNLLSVDEYNRKQIESSLEYLKNYYAQMCSQKFTQTGCNIIFTTTDIPSPITINSINNLKDHTGRFRNVKTTNLFSLGEGTLSLETRNIITILQRIIPNIIKLRADLLKLTKIESLKNSITEDTIIFINEAYYLGLIDTDKKENLEEHIQDVKTI